MLIEKTINEEKKLRELRKKLGREELLLQCAEECSELAIACSKTRRALSGTTPVSLREAVGMVNEAAGDVLLLLECLIAEDLLDPDAARRSAGYKIGRWYERTFGKEGACGQTG